MASPGSGSARIVSGALNWAWAKYGAALTGCVMAMPRAISRLHGVNVIMDRAGMVRIPGEHALQRRHDGDALRVRLTSAGLPVVPWTKIHHRLGVENRDLVVLRELH